MKNKPEPTHDDGESIACPYCGETWADLWEHDWGDIEKCIDIECPYCDKPLILCNSISVSYTCYPKGDE